MFEFSAQRHRMIDAHIAARGIHDPAVLAAMGEVPRELFIPEELAEFAYADAPLPIEEGQTISQPYIVALMVAALRVGPRDRVLEIGTGSGYAAAVLGRVAGEVFTVERQAALATLAEQRFQRLGYHNIHVLEGDGTLGWVQHAPYAGIVVTAGGPSVPTPLLEQLEIGGRLVIPVGSTPRIQRLLRVTRTGKNQYEREELEEVRFVPLIGQEGWADEAGSRPSSVVSRPETLAALIADAAEPLPDIESTALDALIERIGDARVVLLGEASHGTAEFYRMRARITRELITRRGFNLVAVEADWPDASRIDRHVRHLGSRGAEEPAFTRFPTWMWRNREVQEFVEWLCWHNGELRDPDRRVSFHGLDLYSLFSSIAAVLRYLDDVDPDAARVARLRYGCLTPWERDPARYGQAALTGQYRACESQVVTMLRDMLEHRLDYATRDGERFLDAVQNARLVANAEKYYRVMYYGAVESWNLRDSHMFDTLQLLLAARGPETRAVVWEHNSHIGDAAATEMGVRGEFNLGHLCRGQHGMAAYLVGFGTDHGRVAAASDWGGPMEIKDVRPAHPESYERLCHDSGCPAFLLHLRTPRRPEVRDELLAPRLERAIGVIYRPETELESHYFQASLPLQFDEYVWFDETRAVTPLGSIRPEGVPDTYPFGL